MQIYGEIGGDATKYRNKFKAETVQWEQLAQLLTASDQVELNKESDWWLEYIFDRLFEYLKTLGSCLTGGYFFQNESQQRLNRQKKDDDYRPEGVIPPEDHEFRFVLGLERLGKLIWDYSDCELCTRKIHKRRNSSKAMMNDFHANAVTQFDRLKSKKFKDLHLIVEGYAFPVDSYMLITQSSRFRQHFFQPQDSLLGPSALEINDMTLKEMEAFLVYIYSRTWPTHVISRNRPSNRFFDILRLYGVSLKIHKEDIVRRSSSLEEVCLVDTILDDVFNPREERSEKDKNYEKVCNSKLNQFHEMPYEETKSSRWNFEIITEGFINSNVTNLSNNRFEQNEDLRVKKEQARKLLESEDIIESFEREVKLVRTTEWVVNQMDN